MFGNEDWQVRLQDMPTLEQFCLQSGNFGQQIPSKILDALVITASGAPIGGDLRPSQQQRIV